MGLASDVVVLDFETTGISPGQGDRAIEIGAVRLADGQIVERFQSLMDPGRRISGFIESYTGISNAMVQSAPPCAEVMADFADFIGDANLVAHNASFDQRFLDAELARIGRDYGGDFACSMLIARRLFQEAPNHKLGTLVDYTGLSGDGRFHRALYDAEMTGLLWLRMLEEIEQRADQQGIPFSLMRKLAKTPKGAVGKLLTES